MKLYKYLTLAFAAGLMFTGTSCSDDKNDDPYTVNRAYLYQPYSTYASVEYKANGQFLVDIDNPLKLVQVRLTKPAPGDIEFKIDVDPTLVEEYNAANGTNYVYLEGCSIVNPTMTVKKGEYISADSITVSFGDKSGFQSGAVNYVLPVVIKDAPGAVVSKSSRVFLTFTSNYRANIVNVNNYNQVVDEENPNWATAFRTLNVENFVTTTWPADDPITVKVSIDNSLIPAYNAATGETYEQIQATLAQSTLTIAAGESSADLTLNIGDYSGVITESKQYVIPLKVEVEGVGAEAAVGTEVRYITIVNFIPYYVPGSSRTVDGLVAYDYDADTWSATNLTTGASLTARLYYPQGYSRLYEGEQVLVDFGSVKTIQAFGFQFYAWYYSVANFTYVGVSSDGDNYTELLCEGDYPGSSSAYVYLNLGKPLQARYLKFTVGGPSYSSSYGTYIKGIWAYN